MQQTIIEKIHAVLLGGPAHNIEIDVQPACQKYEVPIHDAHMVAVYARNETGKPEFIFAGYSG